MCGEQYDMVEVADSSRQSVRGLLCRTAVRAQCLTALLLHYEASWRVLPFCALYQHEYIYHNSRRIRRQSRPRASPLALTAAPLRLRAQWPAVCAAY